MQHVEQLLSSLVGGLPSIIYAILLLLLAVLIAFAAKAIVVRLCRRFKLDQRINKHDQSQEQAGGDSVLVDTIGKIVFVLVFVLFLPGILDSLNLHGVSQPITNMMDSLLGYLPSIIGAIAIFIIGNLLAKTVKQIIVNILDRVKLDKLQEKMGIKPDETTIGFSVLIGNIVYALILIVAAISALHVLNIEAISVPAMGMLNDIFAMIPNVFTAILLIFVGVMLGKLVGSLLSAFLSGIGINNLAKEMFNSKDGSEKKILLSNIIGDFVKYIIVILFVVQSFSVLYLDVLNDLGVMIISYLPHVVGAVVILALGLFLSNFLEKTLKKHASISPAFAKLIKSVIMAVAVFMTLNQLNIAAFIVNAAFVIILCAIAVAFAIAFGIGGRDFAAKTLEAASTKMDKQSEPKEAQCETWVEAQVEAQDNAPESNEETL